MGIDGEEPMQPSEIVKLKAYHFERIFFIEESEVTFQEKKKRKGVKDFVASMQLLMIALAELDQSLFGQLPEIRKIKQPSLLTFKDI